MRWYSSAFCLGISPPELAPAGTKAHWSVHPNTRPAISHEPQLFPARTSTIQHQGHHLPSLLPTHHSRRHEFFPASCFPVSQDARSSLGHAAPNRAVDPCHIRPQLGPRPSLFRLEFRPANAVGFVAISLSSSHTNRIHHAPPTFQPLDHPLS